MPASAGMTRQGKTATLELLIQYFTFHNCYTVGIPPGSITHLAAHMPD